MSTFCLTRFLRGVAPSVVCLWFAAGNLSAGNVMEDHAARMKGRLEAFETEIRGVLNAHCLKCQGGEKTKGEFDLAVREGLLKGGADGPSVVPFHPERSRLLKMMRHKFPPDPNHSRTVSCA